MKDTMKELKTVMIKRRRIDLVAGIVLAGAFRNTMTSLINDVILPPVSTLLTGTNLPNLSYVIKKPTASMPPVAIGYGRFLQTTVDFLIRVYADSCGLILAFLGSGGRNAATIFSFRYSSSR